MAKATSYSGKAGIKVSVNFAPLLEKIQQAGGDVEEATWEAARKGAKVMVAETCGDSKRACPIPPIVPGQMP